MFKDYYSILEIQFPSSPDEVKSAYRKASLKWHPDRNPGEDTEEQMKDVNEAYYILGNPIAKRRYDQEYYLFKQKEKAKQKSAYTEESRASTDTDNSTSYGHSSWHYDYNVRNEDLKHDINQARKNADEFVKDFMASVNNNAQKAVKGAFEMAIPYAIGCSIFGIIVLLVQTCS